MKLSELLQQLAHYPANSEVRFGTLDYCPEGYPEWQDVCVSMEDRVVVIQMDRLTDELLEMQREDNS